MSAAVEGLTDLFGEPPADLRIALWRKEDRTSLYLPAPEEAARFDGAQDVYVSAALVTAESAERIGSRGRLKARDAAGIPGLWADIDVSGTPDGRGGTKTGAAPSREAAQELAHAVLDPTVLVKSGYGLQAWWLFEEPWVFGGEPEREQAAQIVRGFQAALRERAGFALDATHDLARLMRLPGTFNGKGEEPVRVEREEHDGPRYELEDLARLALEAAPSGPPTRAAVSVGAEFPRMKFEALRENSREFARTWDHERSDRGASDWSTSEYDQSLASQAARRGWTADEVGALVGEHRRSRNGSGDEKADRPDYIERTVAKAFEGVGQDTEQSPPVTFDAATGRPLSALDLVRRDFPELSGPNEIARVVKLGGKQSSYIWELASEETVELGSAKELLRPRDAQAAIFDATGVAIPVPKLDIWREVVQRLHAAAEVRAVTLDEREETADWLDDFLHLGGEENFVQKNPDRAAKLANLSQRDPTSFVEGNVAFVRLAHLRRHIVMYRREEPISTKKLSERLGRIGYRRREIAEREGGAIAKGRFYVGPWGGRG